ncbi:unnamed protein product [Adineta steineri]|uniref:Uncharacterized protein n=1 Tax=Adineta steineri TaxID=433720 RepID=A0A815G9X9_9BILA|nr:unnamed protein product [Adineta steineri]
MSFHHLHHHHLAENSWQDRSYNFVNNSTAPNRNNTQVSSSSTSGNVDFQPPYFPPPFSNVSHHSHQHPFEQIQSNHSHNLDYTSSSSVRAMI